MTREYNVRNMYINSSIGVASIGDKIRENR